MQFGCFVLLEGIAGRKEGLVHISELRAEGRVGQVSDVVQRGQQIYVKVLSINGAKTSLSMKVFIFLLPFRFIYLFCIFIGCRSNEWRGFELATHQTSHGSGRGAR